MLLKFENAIAEEMLRYGDQVQVVIEKDIDHGVNMFFTHVTYSLANKRIFPSVLIEVGHMDILKQQEINYAFTKIANVRHALYVFSSCDNMRAYLQVHCNDMGNHKYIKKG